MMRPIDAIFEGGIFRPLDQVSLPEHTRVRLTAELDEEVDGAPEATYDSRLDAVFDALEEEHASGECDVAARHNEHQP